MYILSEQSFLFCIIWPSQPMSYLQLHNQWETTYLSKNNLNFLRMYFILKTLKGYTLSLLTLVAFTGLISSLASLTLLFIESDKFTLDELLLAPSQLPMGQGLQQLRADIIHVCVLLCLEAYNLQMLWSSNLWHFVLVFNKIRCKLHDVNLFRILQHVTKNWRYLWIMQVEIVSLSNMWATLQWTSSMTSTLCSL